MRRSFCWTLALLAAGWLAVPDAAAHRRAYRHVHHLQQAKAVIVLGKPQPMKKAARAAGSSTGLLDLNVKPKATEVWVDGALRGTVERFDGRPGKLRLIAGNHRLKLVTPAGLVVARDIRVRPGVEVDVGLDLR
jgi:hypothetical protein